MLNKEDLDIDSYENFVYVREEVTRDRNVFGSKINTWLWLDRKGIGEFSCFGKVTGANKYYITVQTKENAVTFDNANITCSTVNDLIDSHKAEFRKQGVFKNMSQIVV